MISIAIWSFGIAMKTVTADKYWAVIWVKFLHAGATLIPVLFLHFIFSLLEYGKKERACLIAFYCITCALFFSLFTNLFIQDTVYKELLGYYAVPGIMYNVFALTFFICIVYAHCKIAIVYKRLRGLKKNQIKYVLIASVIGFAGGSTVFLPVFNIQIFPVGNYFVLFYAFIISYAIVQHRLMDISIVIKKSVIYVYASLLLLIPLSGLILYLQYSAFDHIKWPFSIALFCVMFIAAYVFQFLKIQAEKTVEQYLFKNKFDYKKTISDLSRAMVSILDIHELCREIITTTTHAMRVNKASIFIFDEEDGCYKLYDAIGLDNTDNIKRFARDNPLFQWVGEQDEIIIREEMERYSTHSAASSVIETLTMMGSELCLPLVTKQKLIGVINLGMKGKGEMYTHEDLELLETMSNQATVAIENAKLYEDLTRAKVQMQRADRLAALGTLTAGLAHEIRNPLVAIKTFTQLLPTRFDDDEFRDHFLKVTAGEVDRIASLVTELLDFARPSQPKLNSEDLNQVVEKMALLVDTESHKKNIKILKDLCAALPSVTLDKEQIKQVLLNILLNAVDATPENGTISVITRPLTKNGYLDYVQVTIADTGKGIPAEDLEKVFTPFYTTKHTGSGLGLSISHQIVQEHQGTIEVESKQNVGTTFRINLPVNPSLMEKGRQRRSSDEKNVSH
jgi:signal transduction histidine kinase